MSGPTMIIDSSAISSGATTNTLVIPLTFESSEVTSDFVAGDITPGNGAISNFQGVGEVANPGIVVAVSGYKAIALYNRGIDDLTIKFAYLPPTSGTANVKVIPTKNTVDTSGIITLGTGQAYDETPQEIEHWNINDYIMIYLQNNSGGNPKLGAACYFYISNSGLLDYPSSINMFESGGNTVIRYSDIGNRNNTYVQGSFENDFFGSLGGSIWENGSTYGDLYWYFDDSSGTSLVTDNFGGQGFLTKDAGSGSGMYDPSPEGAAFIPLFFFNTSETTGVAEYTADFTAAADGACSAVVNAGAYTSGGIGNQVSNTFTWTYDGTAPFITHTTVANDNSTISVTFDEAVYNTDGGSGSLEVSDFVFSIAGGTATLASTEPITISESGNEYTLGLSLSGTPNGLEVVTVNPASATSIYNEAGIAASVTQSNNTGSLNGPPTITSTTVASDNSTISVIFDETVYSTDGGSGSLDRFDFVFSIAGGIATLASTPSSCTGTIGSEYHLGMSLSGTPNGLELVTVNPASATSIYNAAGYPASITQTNNSGYLNGHPVITGTTVASNNSTISVTFDEAVYNTDGGSGSLEISDFVFSIAGGSATLASTEPITISESGNEYTLGLSLSGIPNGSEVVTVNPASATSIYNVVGLAAHVIQSNNFGSLNAVPTITGTTVANDNSTISVTFAAAVYSTDGGSGSLEVSDFVFSIAGGTATLASTEPATISESGNEYTLGLSLSGIPNGSEVVTVNPASATSIYNAAGLPASTSQSNNLGSLNAEPFITDTSLASDNSTITVTFAAAVYSTDGGSGSLDRFDFDFVLVGGVATLASTPSTLSSAGNEYTLGLSLSGIPNGSEVVTVNPASATSIYNAAGLPASTSQSNNTVNLLNLPTMTISSTIVNGTSTNISPIPLTFTSSEVTSDFVAGSITPTNGTLSGFSGGGITYTADFTATGTGDPVVDCEAVVAPGAYTSSATGASNSVSNTFEWTYDTVPPTMTITSSTVNSGSSTNVSLIAVTFTSSEDTTDFESAGVTPFNGSISAFSGGGATYTASFTPSSEGICNMVVDPDTFKDAAGNFNTVSNTFTFTYDTTKPTMAITSATVNSGSSTGDTSIDVTFTSSETTINFASGDITVTNGSISVFGGSGTTYTATFTSDVGGTCSILVAAGKFTDTAGNFNTVSNTFSWTYIDTGPTMTITSHVVLSGSSVDVKKLILIFTSSFATNDFTLADISFTGGTLSSFSCVDCNSAGSIYTAVFIIADICTTAAVWVEAGKYTDVIFHHPNSASTTFSWTYVPICPIAAILPTGVLAPHSGNLSQKMRQANKVIYSSSHGGQKYISNKPYIDPKIRPIGKIYYTRYITFYIYSDPLTISTFFSMFTWSNYGNTLSESLELATLFLTMLSNVPRRLSADHLLPYYATTTEVSYLKYVDGSITGGDILLTDTQPYFLIFNNLS